MGGGGSPTILNIYMNGAYKNVQGDSSVLTPEPPDPPRLGHHDDTQIIVLFFWCFSFLITIENMLFLKNPF